MIGNRLRTWERDDVVEDLKTALAITAELDPPAELQVAVFNAAAAMVTQRTVEQLQAVDLSQLRGR